MDDDQAEFWKDIDSFYEKNVQQVTENDTQEFKTMMAQLSKVLGGVLSEKLTVSTISDWTSTASVLTIDGKIAHRYGSKVRSKPDFFKLSPTDVRSLKFVSNFALSLDDSAKIENLYDSMLQSPVVPLPVGYVQVMNLPDFGIFSQRLHSWSL